MIEVIETPNRDKINFVVLNKAVRNRNLGYTNLETAKEEIIIEAILWGKENVYLVDFELIKNHSVVIDETTKGGGDVRVDNSEMIRTNGQCYQIPSSLKDRCIYYNFDIDE
jgi:hypothetical protein